MKICVKLLVSDPGLNIKGRRETVRWKVDQVTRQTAGWAWGGGFSRRGVGEARNKLTARRTDDRMDGRKPQIFLLRK